MSCSAGLPSGIVRTRRVGGAVPDCSIGGTALPQQTRQTPTGPGRREKTTAPDLTFPTPVRQTEVQVGTLELTGVAGRAGAEAISESALIRAAQKDDHDAFEQLVRLYDRSVLRVALNLLRSEEDARDAYQEVFLRTYRSLGGFRFQCSFHTWLYRIATNVCLDVLRRKGVRKEQPLGSPLGANADGPASDPIERAADQRAESDPDRVLATAELSRGITEALDRLTPKERVVFEMRHYEGLRLRAIGEVLSMSEEATKHCLFRATRKMRTALKDVPR